MNPAVVVSKTIPAPVENQTQVIQPYKQILRLSMVFFVAIL